MILLLVSLVMLLIIGFIVFGGGQVFIPFFRILWNILNAMGANISEEMMDSVITISNSTPGVFSTKLAFITGYLVADGSWWAWLSVLVTYLVFIVPSIFVMLLGMRFLKKIKTNKTGQEIIKVLNPVIGGIMIAVCIQLFLSAILPFLDFNNLLGKYISITAPDFSDPIVNSATFFSGWRFWVLLSWMIVGTGQSLYLLGKLKLKFPVVLLINLAVAFTIFQPWLF